MVLCNPQWKMPAAYRIHTTKGTRQADMNMQHPWAGSTDKPGGFALRAANTVHLHAPMEWPTNAGHTQFAGREG
jgi:hypothetical protein